VFNRAIDDEVISQELYPFRKFKIKNAEKEKVSLTPEQIKRLYEYEFKTPALRMARDFWMLSFFLCGINPVDLYNLKKPENGKISFIRTKMQHGTNSTIRLLIQPEAQKIIEQYKNNDKSEYLLMFIDKYVSYDIFKSFLSKKIRSIPDLKNSENKKIFEDFKGLTMYWARYSWATIADSIGIQEKTISKGLGHVDKSLAGRKYIASDWSKVDVANRQVIDFVLSD
jgi:integrase